MWWSGNDGPKVHSARAQTRESAEMKPLKQKRNVVPDGQMCVNLLHHLTKCTRTSTRIVIGPQNSRIFLTPRPLSLSHSRNLCYLRLLVHDPPSSADIIYGNPLTRIKASKNCPHLAKLFYRNWSLYLISLCNSYILYIWHTYYLHKLSIVKLIFYESWWCSSQLSCLLRS